ncbi:TPA: transcriptional regulator [Serratia fonticola]
MRMLGYLLDSETDGVLFLREQALLIPLNGLYKPVRLRKTMFRLLDFMLEKGEGGLICDEVIMKNVWEGYGLRASTPRLWQVMNDLKKKLYMLGVNNDLILRVEGRGYMIDTSLIEPVYIRAAYKWFRQFLIEKPEASKHFSHEFY